MDGRGRNGPSQQGGLEVEEEAHTREGWEQRERRGERHTEARPTVCTRPGAAAQRLRTAPSAAVFTAAVSRVLQPSCACLTLLVQTSTSPPRRTAHGIGTKEHLIFREVGAGLRLVRVAVRHESPHARATKDSRLPLLAYEASTFSPSSRPTDENR